MSENDEALLQRIEEALTRASRNEGLNDELIEVLAAVRIRLGGADRGSLDDLMKAAGDLKGKRSLDDVVPPKKAESLDDVLAKKSKTPEWPA